MALCSLYIVLCTLLLATQCRCAVTWTALGCDGLSVNGASVDSMWDNALAMATQAKSLIDTVEGASVIVPKTSTSRAANNAKFMFGASFGFTKTTGVTSSSKTTLSGVSGVYNSAAGLLQGNSGYLICTGAGLTYAPIGGYLTGAWYYPIPESEDVIILRFTAGGGSNNRPCTDGLTLGQTFRGDYLSNGNTQEVVGIIFCTNQFTPAYKGTLTLGYSVTGDFPNPDTYKSASGTILHEMIHAINTDIYQDQRNPTAFGDNNAAYGYSRAAWLAENNLDSAIINPDNYRIFAEMGMSPATRWGAPPPPGAILPSSKRGVGLPRYLRRKKRNDHLELEQLDEAGSIIDVGVL